MKSSSRVIVTVGSDAEYSEGWVGAYSCELGLVADGDPVATLRFMCPGGGTARSEMLASVDSLTNALIRLRLKIMEAVAQDEAEQAKAAEAASIAFSGVLEDVEASNG